MKKITLRNLIYSSLALALASSYVYVQSQTHPSIEQPLAYEARVASDQQQVQTQAEAQTAKYADSTTTEKKSPESEMLVD